ncbi:MAG: hypothetical protein EBZ59_04175 [Planctomycetia bacterium]|nr:hypothetical protein [Planctomycetia bacterium]
MPIASDTPVIVGPADFNLPRISKLSDGVLELRDVWLLPGSAGLHDREGAPIEETFLRRGRDLGEYPGGRP